MRSAFCTAMTVCVLATGFVRAQDEPAPERKFAVPVIRMDTAWELWHEWAKDKEPAAKWRLTQRGKIFDGVHPGLTGSLFFALVIARELVIAAEQFDEAAPALGVDKTQAAEIKKFVYGWTELPLLPQRKGEE